MKNTLKKSLLLLPLLFAFSSHAKLPMACDEGKLAFYGEIIMEKNTSAAFILKLCLTSETEGTLEGEAKAIGEVFFGGDVWDVRRSHAVSVHGQRIGYHIPLEDEDGTSAEIDVMVDFKVGNPRPVKGYIITRGKKFPLKTNSIFIK